MKKSKFFTLTIVATAIIFTSCSKDEATKANNTANLTAKDWKITAISLTTSAGTSDILKYKDPCEKDNLLKFNTDGTVIEKAGATKCSSSDPDVKSAGNWFFLNNETKLRIIYGDTTLYDINTLNSSTAILKSTGDYFGQNATITMTLSTN